MGTSETGDGRAEPGLARADRRGLGVSEDDARHGLVVGLVPLAEDVRGDDLALVLADVGQWPDAGDVADRPQALAGAQVGSGGVSGCSRRARDEMAASGKSVLAASGQILLAAPHPARSGRSSSFSATRLTGATGGASVPTVHIGEPLRFRASLRRMQAT